MAQTDEEMKTAQPANETAVQQAEEQQEARPATTFEQIKQQVSEDDDAPVGSLTLRTILGGDILSAAFVRRQVWLLLLIVLFITISVAFRYQCQQDQIQIAKREQQLEDVKYKAMSTASMLTERTRKSRILESLQQNQDSILHVSTMPPYVIHIDNGQ